MRRHQQGSALMVVLMATMVLLPLALTLLVMVTSRLRQTVAFRDMIQQEEAARVGVVEAVTELSGGSVALKEREGAQLRVDALSGTTVSVHVGREADVVVSRAGRILTPLEAASVNLSQVSMDPEGRLIFEYRKIELYVVEATVPSRGQLPGVRARAVLVRKPSGEIAQAGVRLERGFFGSGS